MHGWMDGWMDGFFLLALRSFTYFPYGLFTFLYVKIEEKSTQQPPKGLAMFVFL
jgi:hypothetical protein